jgi:hypothetical protein
MHTATQTALQRATVWGLLHVFTHAVGGSQHGQILGASNATAAYNSRLCRWEVEVGHPSSPHYNFATSSIGWKLNFRQGLGLLCFETDGMDVADWEWRADTTNAPLYDVPEELCDALRAALGRYLKHYRVSLDAYAKGVFISD